MSLQSLNVQRITKSKVFQDKEGTLKKLHNHEIAKMHRNRSIVKAYIKAVTVADTRNSCPQQNPQCQF